tara:strand:+ start:723 stop:965 length:243 start_codon:yes stop_codon:yes gene_type:complete
LLLLIQIVNNEKVLGILLVEVDSIDFFVIWLTVADDITEVITVIQNVISRVDKNFHLISDFKFNRDQVNVSLLEKDHHNV